MARSLFSRTKALLSSPLPRRRCSESGQESDALLRKERKVLDEEVKKEDEHRETPFPSPGFIDAASKYILNPSTFHHIPIPKSSSYSYTSQSSPSTTTTSSLASKGIDPTPLANAFANLAVDAGIYGTRDSYVEVLAFQLRRMVRSLAAQCSESRENGGNGCLTLTVSRPELNCSVHITIQTRQRTITHHHHIPLLSRLNRTVNEQIVILGLQPLIQARPLSDSSEYAEHVEQTGQAVQGLYSTWYLKETRFTRRHSVIVNACPSSSGGGSGSGISEEEEVVTEQQQQQRQSHSRFQYEWRITRGRDAWWDVYDSRYCCNKKEISGSSNGKGMDFENGDGNGNGNGNDRGKRKREVKRGGCRMEVSL